MDGGAREDEVSSRKGQFSSGSRGAKTHTICRSNEYKIGCPTKCTGIVVLNLGVGAAGGTGAATNTTPCGVTETSGRELNAVCKGGSCGGGRNI